MIDWKRVRKLAKKIYEPIDCDSKRDRIVFVELFENMLMCSKYANKSHYVHPDDVKLNKKLHKACKLILTAYSTVKMSSDLELFHTLLETRQDINEAVEEMLESIDNV